MNFNRKLLFLYFSALLLLNRSIQPMGFDVVPLVQGIAGGFIYAVCGDTIAMVAKDLLPKRSSHQNGRQVGLWTTVLAVNWMDFTRVAREPNNQIVLFQNSIVSRSR